jgi:T-complex protein 1 subunit beta
MDKILQGSQHKEMQVTNDGATILKAIGVDNPAAKILVGKIDYDLCVIQSK